MSTVIGAAATGILLLVIVLVVVAMQVTRVVDWFITESDEVNPPRKGR